MNNILNLDQTCSQLNLPYCRYISKNSYYATRNYMISKNFRISSICTLILITILIFSLIRVHMHIYKKFASSARSELMLFCDIYLASLMCEFILVTEYFKSKFVLIIQMAFVNTIFAILVWMSVFSTTFDVIHSFPKVRFFTCLHFFLSLGFFSVFINRPEVIFFNHILNVALIFFFMFLQFVKLKMKKAQIWPFGNLFISLIFFGFAAILFFIGNELIIVLCNGYIDGLFLIHVFFFLSFLMLHKFWLSTCDFEIECAVI